MLEDLALELGAFRTGLLEAGGDNNGTLHADIHSIFYDTGDARGRRDDDDQVNNLRHVAESGVGLDAQDAGTLGVDGIDGPAKGAAEQVPDDGAPDAAGVFCGADDGYAFGSKDAVQGLAAIMENIM